MPRPHLQIEVEGETPFRIITSPQKEDKGRFFNILAANPGSPKEGWDWVDTEEIVGLTEEEVIAWFTTALRGLPSYPRQSDGSRKTVQG